MLLLYYMDLELGHLYNYSFIHRLIEVVENVERLGSQGWGEIGPGNEIVINIENIIISENVMIIGTLSCFIH